MRSDDSAGQCLDLPGYNPLLLPRVRMSLGQSLEAFQKKSTAIRRKNGWGGIAESGRTGLGGDSGSRLILGWLLQRLRCGVYEDAADIHQCAVLRVV